MTPERRAGFDRIVRWWPLIVALAGVLMTAAVLADNVCDIEDAVSDHEVRIKAMETTLPAIERDVSWIRTYIENGGRL